MDEEVEYRNYLKRISQSPYNRNRRLENTDKKQIVKQSIVSRLIGENCCHTLVEFEVEFPQRYPCVELKQVHMSVKDLKFRVSKNKVLIQGDLFSSIDYKVYEGRALMWYRDAKQNAILGTIKSISASLPFTSHADIMGAQPGDEVEVKFAGIEESSGQSTLSRPFNLPNSDITLYKRLKQSVLAKICLKVLRQMVVPVNVGEIVE